MDRHFAIGRISLLMPLLLLSGVSLQTPAGSGPYFNTYTHDMEVGEWEFAAGLDYIWPEANPGAAAVALELEHGFSEHFTGALYLLGTREAGASARVDGFKVEGIWRPFLRDSFWIPTFYLEFEHFAHEPSYHDAVVGSRGEGEGEGPFRTENELETRLIFSKDFEKANIALNLIAERNLAGGATEFGYTLGVFLKGPQIGSKTYDTGRSWDTNLLYGAELLGGLGEEGDFGLHPSRQNHYVQPFLSVPVGTGKLVKFAFSKGLNRDAEDKVRVYLVFHL